jgi:hypothetical protein
MGKLIVPQRGQPLDVSYMYDIVQALNELQDQVGSSIQDVLVVVDETNKSRSTKMNRSAAFGVTAPVITATSVELNKTYPVTVSFEVKFNSKPIVVATPNNIGGTEPGKSANVVITKITNNSAEFLVSFTTAGLATVSLNVLAMGIPI